MPFSYVPLSNSSKSIRLLQILPAADGEPLQLLLHPDFYFDPMEFKYPDYVALSYMWGPPPATYQVTVGGEEFLIRKNLHDFLLRLRQLGMSEKLWTDAICINQSNLPEKSEQVNIMDKIYTHARDVYVWLGDEADGSGSVMKAANAQVMTGLENYIVTPGDLAAQHIMHETQLLSSLSAFVTRSYWTRTWILQEIYLAIGQVTIFCGNHQTTLDRLDYLVQSYVDHLILEGEPSPGAWADGTARKWAAINGCTLYRLQKAGGETYRPLLQELLHLHGRLSRCENPRDKIYALQNMSRGIRLPINYTIDVGKLFWHVVGHCKSADPAFGHTVLQSLNLSIADARLYDDLLRLSDFSLCTETKTGVPPEDDVVSDIALHRIGSVGVIEDYHVNPNASSSNSILFPEGSRRFKINVFSPSHSNRGRFASGISTVAMDENDALFLLTQVPDLALLIRRENKESSARSSNLNCAFSSAAAAQQQGPYSTAPASASASKVSILGFAFVQDVLRDSMQSPARGTNISTLISYVLQMLSRMNATPERLVARWSPSLVHEKEGWESRYDPLDNLPTSLRLVLNSAAVLSLLEHSKFREENENDADGEARLHDSRQWADLAGAFMGEMTGTGES